jgi:hypothetical protein
MIIRVEDKEKMGDKRFEVIRGEMIGFTGVVKIEMMGVIKKNG